MNGRFKTHTILPIAQFKTAARTDHSDHARGRVHRVAGTQQYGVDVDKVPSHRLSKASHLTHRPQRNWSITLTSLEINQYRWRLHPRARQYGWLGCRNTALLTAPDFSSRPVLSVGMQNSPFMGGHQLTRKTNSEMTCLKANCNLRFRINSIIQLSLTAPPLANGAI